MPEWFEVESPPLTRRARVKQIIVEEASRGHVSIEDILSRTRRARAVKARRCAMVRARSETGLGYNTLAQLFHKDHTTIIAAVGRFLGLSKGKFRGKLSFPSHIGDLNATCRDYPTDALGEVHTQAAPASQEIPF